MIPSDGDVHHLAYAAAPGVLGQGILTVEDLDRYRAVHSLLVAQLPLVVGTPGPKRAVLHHSQGEAIPGGDTLNVLQIVQALPVLNGIGIVVDLGIVQAQLAPVIVAGGVQLGLLVFVFSQEQDMISAGSDGDNVLQRHLAGGPIIFILHRDHDLLHSGLLVAHVLVGIHPPGMAADGTEPDLELPLLLGNVVLLPGVVINLDRCDHFTLAVHTLTAMVVVIATRLTAGTHKGIVGGHVPDQTALLTAPLTGVGLPAFIGHVHLKDLAIGVNDKPLALRQIGGRLVGSGIIGYIVAIEAAAVTVDIVSALIGVAVHVASVAIDMLSSLSVLLFIGGYPVGGIGLPALAVGQGLGLVVHLMLGAGDKLDGVRNGLIPHLTGQVAAVRIAVPVGTIFGHVGIRIQDHLVAQAGNAVELTDDPGMTVFIQQQGKGIPRGNIHDLCKGFLVVGHLDRIAPAEEGPVAQLTVSVVTPGPHSTVSLQDHGMVQGSGDLGLGESAVLANAHLDDGVDVGTLAGSQNIGGAVGAAKLELSGGSGGRGLLQNIAVQHVQNQIARINVGRLHMGVEVEAHIDLEYGRIGQGDSQLLAVLHHDLPVQSHQRAAAGGDVTVKLQRRETLPAHPDGNIAVQVGEIAQLAQAVHTSGVHIAVINAEGHMVTAHVEGPGDLHIGAVVLIGGAGAVHGLIHGVHVPDLDFDDAALGVLHRHRDRLAGAHLTQSVLAPGQQGQGSGQTGIAILHRIRSLDQGGVSAGGHGHAAPLHHQHR